MRSLDSFFTEDTRAVAPVIGFVLLFGIGVVAFSGYQAVQVPQQNAETEFQHQEKVQNDLIVLRNAISRAGQQNERQFESVRLGTTYRERILAVNPPAPAGTLRTRGPYNITIDNGTSDPIKVETRFLKYQDGYNELDANPIYYEHSVLYLEPETGNRVFFEDQNLVRENSDVVITALQRNFSQSDTGRVTIELYPMEAGDQLPTGELDVTLPTRLPEGYWQEQLGGTDPISNIGYNDPGGDIKEVTFTVNSSDLEFNTVGINDAPDPNSDQTVVSDMDGSGEKSANGDVLDDVRASELVGDTNNQEQEFEIDLGQDLDGGEEITIDLGFNTGGITYSTGNQYGIVDGDGEVTKDGNLLTYTAGANDNAGDTITITADKVKVDSIGGESRSIEANINDESKTAEFPILKDGDFDSEEYEGGDVFVTGDVTVGEGEVISGDIDAGEDVEVKEGGDVQGSISSGGEVTVKEGGEVQGSVDADGEVTVADVTGSITAGGDVEVKEGGDVQGSINSQGEVIIKEDGKVQGPLNADGDVTVKQGGEVQGSVDADGKVTVADVTGSITAGGDVEVKDGGEVQGSIDSGGDVTVKDGGEVQGSVDADGEVTVKEGGEVQGEISEG